MSLSSITASASSTSITAGASSSSSPSPSPSTTITNYLESINAIDKLFNEFQINLKNKLREVTITWLFQKLFHIKSTNQPSTLVNNILNDKLENEMNIVLHNTIKLELNDQMIEELIKKTTLEYIAYIQIRRSAIIQNVKDRLELEFAS